MAEVQLPLARRGSLRSVRGIELPTAADVAPQRSVADPGLRVPGPVGSGLEEFGKSLMDLGVGVWRDVDRQRKEYDAIKIGEAELEADRQFGDEFRRLQKEDDVARPEFMSDYETWMNKRKEEMVKTLPKDVSPLAKEKLRLRIGEQQGVKRDAAGKMSLDASTKRSKDVYGALASRLANQAEIFPEHVDLILNNANSRLEEFKGTLNAEDERDQLAAARITIIKSAVTGWFRKQPDQLRAIQQLHEGKVGKELQHAYAQLSPEERIRLFRAIVDDSSKLATIENQQRDKIEKEEKLKTDGLVKDFFFNDKITDEVRVDLIRQIRSSPHVNKETLFAMEKLVREGNRGAAYDVEQDLLDAESAIRREDVKDENSLIDYIGQRDLRVSTQTLRSRLLPMVEKRRDETFMSVLRWGQSELGIITGSVLGDFFKDPVNKAAKFEAELRRFQKATPTADLWQHAEKTVDLLKKQANVAATVSLPALVSNYRKALSSGSIDQIANAKLGLGTVMVEAGLIDPLIAARADFDPLKIIDEPRKP